MVGPSAQAARFVVGREKETSVVIRFTKYLYLVYAAVLIALIVIAILSFTGYWENDFANPAV